MYQLNKHAYPGPEDSSDKKPLKSDFVESDDGYTLTEAPIKDSCDECCDSCCFCCIFSFIRCFGCFF